MWVFLFKLFNFGAEPLILKLGPNIACRFSIRYSATFNNFLGKVPEIIQLLAVFW
jgi:hypothetical protein